MTEPRRVESIPVGLADEYRSALCAEYALFQAWCEAFDSAAAIRQELLSAHHQALVNRIEEDFANDTNL